LFVVVFLDRVFYKCFLYDRLLWIYILVPQSSFVGHLCGIVSGLLYTMGYFDFIIEPLVGFLPDIDFQNIGGAGQEPGREQYQEGDDRQFQQQQQQPNQNQRFQQPNMFGPFGFGGMPHQRRFVRDGILH
jgi:hypothetical protein